ncbi:MAG: MmgE/PrpD family protein [Acetobacteraceae bacterium]
MNQPRQTAEQTRTLGAFVAGLTFGSLPTRVAAQAGDVILDTLGCCIAAWTEDPDKAAIATKLAGTFRADPVALIWGSRGVRTDAGLAALANGILANAADYDDTHKRALLHTGSVIVPVVLALAEEKRLTGRQVLTAIVAGYEVAVRVGMTVMPSHYRFWHSTATNGTFGAAASAASALGLDAERATFALGFAGTQAAGLNTFFSYGDFTKSLHPGKAALNGVISARLAAIGATSPPTMIEHDKGYARAYSENPDMAAPTRGLGTDWEILQNGFKWFPSILASHAPIQATLDIVIGNDVAPAEIDFITNETYATVKSHFSNKAVDTPMGARVSVPYCVAIAAMDRQVGQAQFAPERVRDPAVRDLLARTETVADPELTKLYPDKFPARVTIGLKDGRRLTETRYFPKGDPQEPLTPGEIEAKFLNNATGRISATAAREVVRLVRELQAADDLSRLFALLAG